MILHRETGPIFILLSFILILSFLWPGGFDVSSMIIRYANFIAAILIFNYFINVPKDDLQKDLYVILRFFAYQAIITFFLAIFANFLFETITINDTPYSTILFLFTYHTFLEDLSALARPDGFFYEPGVFQIYLNIYLYLCLFVFKKNWQALIAIAAVLTTQSTPGIFICLFLLFYYVMIDKFNKTSFLSKEGKLFFGLLFIIPIAAIAYLNFNEKFYGEFIGSSWARQYDLITGINVVKKYPLAGIGFNYDEYYKAATDLGFSETVLSDENIANRANSNGILTLLYSIGIPLSIPFILGIFSQTFFKHKLLIAIILFVSALSEQIIFTPFYLFLIFSGISYLAYKRQGTSVKKTISYT